MTLRKLLYLKLFTEAYNTYVSSIIKNRKYISNINRFSEEVRLTLANIYLEIILYYYTITIDTDENSLSVAEIKEIINRFNLLVDSEIEYSNE